MKTRWFVLLAVLLLAGCDLGKWTYDSGLSAEKWRAGLEDHNLTTSDGIQWHLLRSKDAANKPPVLLIHGFGADSSNWIRFANEMEGQYNFIVPDLPGHGDSTRNLTLDYSIPTQAKRLLLLADTLRIQHFHVAGSSMGGAIALSMTLQAPKRVLSLGLVDAAGVTLLTPEFAALLKDGNNPLIPHRPDDMATTMAWAMANPPWLPDFFVEQMGALKAANAKVAEKVFADVKDVSLRQRLPQIQAPTLIVWGDKDRLLSLANVAIFDDAIPHSEARVFAGLGHLPMAEDPGKTADAFRPFWQQHTPAELRF